MIFYGDREKWLKKLVYLQSDFTAEDFATNLEFKTVEEKIRLGYPVEEPEFINDEIPFH